MRPFFHGSRCFFEVGFKLEPQPNGYVQQQETRDFELLLESRRPESKLSRFDSVFLSRHCDLIDGAGGYSDVIYIVEPSAEPEASDLAWYTDAYCEYETEPRNTVSLNAMIDSYWSGVRYHKQEHSNFEFRVASAVVLEIAELNVSIDELEQVVRPNNAHASPRI